MERFRPFYVTKLEETLSCRKKENPQYSLRAFSRDLGVNPGTLVKIFRGERPLPIKASKKILENLELGPSDRTLFMESLLRRRVSMDDIKINPEDKSFIIAESHENVISEWEHLAVLKLFDLPDFKASPEAIARRFSIPLNRAEVVARNLLECGLLGTDQEGRLFRIHAEVKTTEDGESLALKESQIQFMKMGITKIEEIELELRDFSSMTAAIDLEKIPEARTIIAEFRQKMKALLKDGPHKTEVFQLGIQFYPLTDLEYLNCHPSQSTSLQ